MKFGIIVFIIGLWLGVMIVGIFQHFVPDSNYNVVHNARTKCEQSLPRDQQCIIIAIPKAKQL